MRLNYIELQNYRKFERARLELPDGIIGIVGDNGVGKSTLVESIAWALFGNQKDIVRAGKESIRRDEAKLSEPTSVKLEFTFAGEEYVVTREMSGKALVIDAKLLVNGHEMARGSKEVSGYIEKKLGMDYKSFFISVFAKQKDLAALSALTDGERRMTILRMLGIDRLDDVIEDAGKSEKIRRERVDASRATLRDESGRLKKEILVERRKKLSSDLTAAEKIVASLRTEQVSSKQREDEFGQRYTEISKMLKELRERNSKYQMSQTRLASSLEKFEQMEKDLKEAEKAEKEAAGLASLNEKIMKEKDKQEKLLSAKAAHDRLLEKKGEVSSLEKEIVAIDRDIAKRADDIKKNADLAKAIKENFSELDKIQNELTELKDHQAELRARTISMRDQIGKDVEHLKEIDRLGPDGVCPTCERPLKEHQGKLMSKLTASIEKSKKLLAELESDLAKCEKGQKDKTGALDALKRKSDAFAKKERHLAQLEMEHEHLVKSKGEREAKKRKLENEISKSEAIGFKASELENTIELIEGYDRQRDTLMGLVVLAKKLPELRKSYDNLQLEINKHRASAKEFKIDPAEIEILETTAGEMQSKKEDMRRESDALYEKLMTASKQKESVDSEMTIVEKELAAVEDVTKKLVALENDLAYAVKLQELMRDFKVRIVARIIPMLSDIASGLLSQLTEGRYTSLTLDDGYNIFIEDGGEKHILERFSGGESDLANLCLRLAISRVIAERTGTEGINLLVLDEIFGSQDASRKRNLMASFNALSMQFRQIFLITHVDDVREYLTSVIEVHQDEAGTSHASLAQ